MAKVYENTGKKILIYSDNGLYRLTATRRAITEDWNGITKFYGSKWHIETHKREGYGFVSCKFSGLPYVVGKKQEIMDLLSKSVQFKQAYAELKEK